MQPFREEVLFTIQRVIWRRNERLDSDQQVYQLTPMDHATLPHSNWAHFHDSSSSIVASS